MMTDDDGKRSAQPACSNVNPLAMDRPFQDPAVDPVLCSRHDPPGRHSARNAGDVAVENVGGER